MPVTPTLSFDGGTTFVSSLSNPHQPNVILRLVIDGTEFAHGRQFDALVAGPATVTPTDFTLPSTGVTHVQDLALSGLGTGTITVNVSSHDGMVNEDIRFTLTPASLPAPAPGTPPPATPPPAAPAGGGSPGGSFSLQSSATDPDALLLTGDRLDGFLAARAAASPPTPPTPAPGGGGAAPTPPADPGWGPGKWLAAIAGMLVLLALICGGLLGFVSWLLPDTIPSSHYTMECSEGKPQGDGCVKVICTDENKMIVECPSE